MRSRRTMGAGRIPHSMLRRPLALIGLLLAGLLAIPTPVAQASPGRSQLPGEIVSLVGEGWLFLESGNLDKALESFTAAYEADGGKDYAEVYYSLAMIWWERRNALAALRWLDEAVKAREGLGWKRVANKEWDHRIDGRRRYILKNFTVVKLRAPDRAAGLPPLADPPPSDPLLRRFTGHVEAIVAEAHTDGVHNLWVLIPNGHYWIGEDLLNNSGGEVDMTKAVEWDLVTDRAPTRKAYLRRLSSIETGKSEGAELLERWEAERRAADEHAAAVRNQRPLTYTSVASADTGRVAADISSSWPLDSFRVRYLVITESTASRHEIGFPKLGFSVAFDPDGRLKIDGHKKLSENLGAEWRIGLAEIPNNVELLFDGVNLSVTANGLSFGPIAVRRGEPEGHGTEWTLSLSDDNSALRALEISKYSGPQASVDRGR